MPICESLNIIGPKKSQPATGRCLMQRPVRRLLTYRHTFDGQAQSTRGHIKFQRDEFG